MMNVLFVRLCLETIIKYQTSQKMIKGPNCVLFHVGSVSFLVWQIYATRKSN